MFGIKSIDIPDHAFLKPHADRPECFTDAYVTDVPTDTELSEFIIHFYCSWLFRLERRILARWAHEPSSDEDVHALAHGRSDRFAVWDVAERDERQIFLRVRTGRFYSWLMVEPIAAQGTRLYFGSAVEPRQSSQGVGFAIRALSGFHMLYSRALLAAARRSIIKAAGSSAP